MDPAECDESCVVASPWGLAVWIMALPPFLAPRGKVVIVRAGACMCVCARGGELGGGGVTGVVGAGPSGQGGWFCLC